MGELRAAAQIFPLGHYTRERPAYAAVSVGRLLPAQFVDGKVLEALRNDPWSPDLRIDHEIQQVRMAQ